MRKHSEHNLAARPDDQSSALDRLRLPKWLAATFAVLVAGCILPGTVAANGFEVPAANPSNEATPWDPPVVANLREYPLYPDRNFNGGRYVGDAFFADSSAANNYFEGKKVVKLDNGDLVVAALVKKPNGNQGNGLWNIGLVRYNANGTARRQWSNPAPAYSHIEGQYVIYPNTVTATYNYIRDIKAIGGKLVVFANRSYQAGPDIDVDLLVFGEDGALQSVTVAFGTSAAEYAEGLETYSAGIVGATNYVLALATHFVADGGRPVFKRFSLDAAGTLTQENPDMTAVNVKCTTAGQQCFGRGIATGQPDIPGNPPSIYVVTEFRSDANTVDGSFVVTRVNSNGVKSASWDPGNINWHASNGGDRHDWPIGIVVQSGGSFGNPVDSIFVGVNIGQGCRDGIAVVRFSSADNGVSPSLTRFGGSTSPPIFCGIPGANHSDNATSMVRHGTTIALAGYRFVSNASSDSAVYVVDTNLAVLDQRVFSYPIGGPRTRESLLSGITSIGGLKFLATGYTAYPGGTQPPSLVGKTEVAIIQFAPDRIFGGSFGVGAD